MSRQYTDSSDELCPLGGKAKYCTNSVPVKYWIDPDSASTGISETFCGKQNYPHLNKISYVASEWTKSDSIARVSKALFSEILDKTISCSGTKIASCGESGSDVWYKK